MTVDELILLLQRFQAHDQGAVPVKVALAYQLVALTSADVSVWPGEYVLIDAQ